MLKLHPLILLRLQKKRVDKMSRSSQALLAIIDEIPKRQRKGLYIALTHKANLWANIPATYYYTHGPLINLNNPRGFCWWENKLGRWVWSDNFNTAAKAMLTKIKLIQKNERRSNVD